MGLLSTVKDLFTKTEVTEEVFEYESIDSYLKKQQQQNDEPVNNAFAQALAGLKLDK